MPTGSLVVLEVSWCNWEASSDADYMAELELDLSIAGNPGFSQLVPYEAVEGSRKWPGSLHIYEDSWEEEDRFFVATVTVGLELEAEDLGKVHDIIVRVDPKNLTKAFGPDPLNRETSVRVDIPADLPEENTDLACPPVP